MQPTLTEDEPLVAEVVLTDRQRLQGIWEYVAGVQEAELLIAGGHYTCKFPQSGKLYMGTYVLDPTADPPRIDMTVEEGPPPYRGRTSLGIYRLDGEILHWCPAKPDEDRPAAFPSPDDSRYLYLILRREGT
jgi:uncharacterized protein (TIGR03067 family)